MAGVKRLLSPSWDWLLDRGFMKSLGMVANPAETGMTAVSCETHRARIGRGPLLYPQEYKVKTMSEPSTEKIKLVKRLSRIRGQVDALQRAIAQETSSVRLLQQATACRGAMDGFIAEIIEDHIREQVVDAKSKSEASRAAEELIGIVHSYLT